MNIWEHCGPLSFKCGDILSLLALRFWVLDLRLKYCVGNVKQVVADKPCLSNLTSVTWSLSNISVWDSGFVFFSQLFSETCHLLVIKNSKLEIRRFEPMVHVFGRSTEHLQCEWLHKFLSEVGIIHRQHFLSSNYIRGICSLLNFLGEFFSTIHSTSS